MSRRPAGAGRYDARFGPPEQGGEWTAEALLRTGGTETTTLLRIQLT